MCGAETLAQLRSVKVLHNEGEVHAKVRLEFVEQLRKVKRITLGLLCHIFKAIKIVLIFLFYQVMLIAKHQPI
jgi:hypothetical protein